MCSKGGTLIFLYQIMCFRNKGVSRSLLEAPLFYFIGNFVSNKAKTLRGDAHSRVWKLLLAATALGARVSRAKLFLYLTGNASQNICNASLRKGINNE
jgi:hypothetical protein